MSETSGLPDLGEQVRPLIEGLPPRVQPRLIAELERVAAKRYEAWAAACAEPAHAEGLRECALREEEVARRVEALFAMQPGDEHPFDDALPKIEAAYRAALAGRPLTEQYAIQAAAERRGAAVWRSLAASLADASARQALLSCAELEERSAALLEALLARTSG